MQYPTNIKTSQKIVQDSKNSNFPVPGKLSKDPNGMTTSTTSIRMNYRAEMRVEQNKKNGVNHGS